MSQKELDQCFPSYYIPALIPKDNGIHCKLTVTFTQGRIVNINGFQVKFLWTGWWPYLQSPLSSLIFKICKLLIARKTASTVTRIQDSQAYMWRDKYFSVIDQLEKLNFVENMYKYICHWNPLTLLINSWISCALFVGKRVKMQCLLEYDVFLSPSLGMV